jgi:adenosylhomocysteine nucleosidase
MSKIGIIVAMEEELESILDIMDNIEEKEIYGLTFKTGQIEKNKIIVVKCGVGKVNAARVTQILIDTFNVKCVINVGAAGALNPFLNIGDIVIGEKLIQHDFDITAFDHDKGYITGVGDYIYSDIELIEKFKKAANNLKEKDYKIKTGIIATGDIFCTDIEMKNKIYSKFDADCVEMEGAAIAQVCYLDNIPFIVIRSISDSPNGNNEIDFDKFVELASKRCANILREFLK